MELGLVGRAAATDLRGRCLIAGLLRTGAGGLGRPLYPLNWCSGTGTRRRLLEDGARAGGASGRDRPTGPMLDRRAVAHRGGGPRASSLSVELVQRHRHAAPTT